MVEPGVRQRRGLRLHLAALVTAYHALVHAAKLCQHAALHVLSLPQLPQPLGKYLIPRHHLPPSPDFFFIACNSIRASVSLMW